MSDENYAEDDLDLSTLDDDELVEVTPDSIRIRKKLLTENERKRAGRDKVA